MNREIKTLMDAAEICGERHNQAAENYGLDPCAGCPLRGVTCAELTGKPGATAMIPRFWVVDTLRKAAEAGAEGGKMTADEAWANLSARTKKYALENGFTPEDIAADVMAFEALRKMGQTEKAWDGDTLGTEIVWEMLTNPNLEKKGPVKVYLTGPITGNTESGKQFAAAAERVRGLRCARFVVLNPRELPEGMSRAEYMRICFAMIDTADIVLFLDGWEKSAGESVERAYCDYIGKPVIKMPAERDGAV